MQIAIVDDNPVNVTLLKVLARQLADAETGEVLDSPKAGLVSGKRPRSVDR